MSDKSIADIARTLAKALMAYARERRGDDQKAIAQANTELCAEYRAELAEQEKPQT